GGQVPAKDVEGLLGQQVRRTILAVHRLRLFARVHLRPRDLLLAAVRLLHRRVEHAHRRFPDVGAGAIAFDEGDDRMVRHAELAVFDGDLVTLGNLPLTCHQTSFPGFALVSRASRCTSSSLAGPPVAGSMTWPAFKAEPARNQAICSRVMMCRAWIVSTRASGFLICTVTGLPGSSV